MLSKVRKAMQITPSRSQRMMLLMTQRPVTMRKPNPEAHRGRGSAHHGEGVAAHGALGDHAAGDAARAGAKMCGRFQDCFRFVRLGLRKYLARRTQNSR